MVGSRDFFTEHFPMVIGKMDSAISTCWKSFMNELYEPVGKVGFSIIQHSEDWSDHEER